MAESAALGPLSTVFMADSDNLPDFVLDSGGLTTYTSSPYSRSMSEQIQGIDAARVAAADAIENRIAAAVHHVATMRHDMARLTDEAEHRDADRIMVRADAAIQEAEAALKGIDNGALTMIEGTGIARAACRRVTRAACALYDLPTFEAEAEAEDAEADEAYEAQHEAENPELY